MVASFTSWHITCIFVVILINLQGLRGQQYVQSNGECADIDQIIHHAPKIRGRVEKKGVLPLNLWWNTQQLDFNRNVSLKIQQENLHIYNDTLFQGDSPIKNQINNFPMSTPCQVFIDTEHKLIYMKTTKTGGSSLYIMFQKMCHREKLRLGVSPQDIQLCMQPPKFVQINDAETAKQIWKDYLVFTTVRNPYSRAASSYEYLLERRAKLSADLKYGCGRLSFESYSLNPFVIAMQSQKYGCTDNPVHDYLHVEEEGQCLLTEDGEFAVDYIFDAENSASNWESLRRDLIERQTNKNSIFVKQMQRVELMHKNKVSVGANYAAELFRNCGKECFVNIANYYRKDFDILGYNDCLDQYEQNTI